MIRLFLFLLVGCGRPADPSPVPPTGGGTGSGAPTGVVPGVPVGVPSGTGPVGQLVEGDPVVCADPSLRETLGPMYTADLGPDWASQRSGALGYTGEPEYGAGLVVADFTGDGRYDVFLPNYTQCLLYVQGPDGLLHDESASRIPEPNAICNGWSASAADADGDGDLDLFIARDYARDMLWLNDGAGNFTDHTEQAGLDTVLCASRSGSWGDMDGDGDLDLLVARHRVFEGQALPGCPDVTPPAYWNLPAGDPNSLYENRGDATFVDVSDRLPFEARYGHAFIGAWQDIDGDLDLDLWIINDFGANAAFSSPYLNDGTGQFERLPATKGLELRGDLMGIGVGDVNEDGRPDYAISLIDRLFLQVSSPPDLWVGVATAAGVAPTEEQRAAWGIELVDMDNDTDLDVVTVYGPTEGPLAIQDPAVFTQPDALFLQEDDGSFVDRAPEWGVDDRAVGRGLLIADLNDDGWLDMVRTDYRTGPARVTLSRCGSESWLAVDFDAPLHGYGVRVEVEVAGRVLTRWHGPSNTAVGVSGPPGVHFGLGPHDRVDELRVIWLDGAVSVFPDVAGRQKVTVRR